MDDGKNVEDIRHNHLKWDIIFGLLVPISTHKLYYFSIIKGVNDDVFSFVG